MDSTYRGECIRVMCRIVNSNWHLQSSIIEHGKFLQYCHTLLQFRKSYILAIEPCHFIAHHACLFANGNVLENEGWHVKWQRQTRQLNKRAAKETRRPTCWVVPCLAFKSTSPTVERMCFGDPLDATQLEFYEDGPDPFVKIPLRLPQGLPFRYLPPLPPLSTLT